jgi:hypothetical protein
MNGWSLEYVRQLDRDVKAVLIDEIKQTNKGGDDDTQAADEDDG